MALVGRLGAHRRQARTRPHAAPARHPHEVLELVQHFVDHVLPLFPVITVAELRALDTLSPVALLAVCAIAASSRRFSFERFDTAREFLRTAIEIHDPRATASLQNVQVRLLSFLLDFCAAPSLTLYSCARRPSSS